MLGPSNPRDLTGMVVDSFMDPWGYVLPATYVDLTTPAPASTGSTLRARNLETLDEIRKGSLDYYATIRSLYRQHRNDAIKNYDEIANPGFPAALADPASKTPQLTQSQLTVMHRRVFLAALAALLPLPVSPRPPSPWAMRRNSSTAWAKPRSARSPARPSAKPSARIVSTACSKRISTCRHQQIRAGPLLEGRDRRRAHRVQRLFEKLLVQSYAKRFAEYSGETFKVTGGHANDDGSIIVNSLIDRPNGDSIRLDWRVEDASGLKIADLMVEGVSLRTTYRSEFASVIQTNGGTVAGLIDALRQKIGTQ